MPGPSQAEQLLRVTSGIASELIKAHDSNTSVSLNELRAKMSKKHGYGGVPRLVDIISAIPDEYKKALLPKLKARPIRTASGVRFFLSYHPTSCVLWFEAGFFVVQKEGEEGTRIADYQHRFVQIAVVAVMCKPHRCPHIAMTGNICVYVHSSHPSGYPIHLIYAHI